MEKEIRILDVLMSTLYNYREIYFVQLEENYYQMLYPDSDEKGERGNYRESIERHLQNIIEKENVEFVRNFLSIENICRELANKNFFEQRYRRLNADGKYEWCVASFTVGERRNGRPITVTLTIRCVEELVKNEERERNFLKNRICEEQAANHAKTDYLSMMSHDIRTPLNIIIGMSTLAKKHQDDKERLNDCFEKIELSSQYLLTLLDDVLDISQIESGKLALAMREFSLVDMISEIVCMVQGMLDGNQQKLEFEFGELFHENVVGDEMRLTQVLVNIISNSIKYSGKGTTTMLKVQEISNMDFGKGLYRFTIQDNGVGMAPEFLKKIFEPYSRQLQQNKGNTGNGLGMSIAKRLVSLMDGKIEVSSEVNRGTEFVVDIPLWQQEQSEMKEVCATVEAHLRENVEFEGIHALLVEDNECNAEIYADMLQTLGVTVELARDGKEAVEIFEKSPVRTFHCIFMDVNMPVMDGITATRKIRSMYRMDSKIPIFAMTANVFVDDIKKFREAGMQDHIGKPGMVDDICEVLMKWFPQKIKK